MAQSTMDATVSREWAKRTADERCLSLYEVGAKTSHQRQISRSAVVSSRELQFAPAVGDEMKGITIAGKAGIPYAPTHWSFGQLASLAGAPAGYLRGLPAPLACDNLNYGFRFARDVADVGLYLRKNGGPGKAMAATGPNYGRVHNADIVERLISEFGDGVTGDWKVPGEFGKDVPVTKANTTLYVSDQDMFLFLADEKNRITVPNRRDGRSGTLARGFGVRNSEVGAAPLEFFFWTFDYACSNRILWNVQDFTKLSIRHTKSAPDRYIEEALPAINALANAAAGPIEATIKAAQAAKVETDLAEFLKAKRFTTSEITGMASAFEADEGRPLGANPSLWDLATAATSLAKGIQYQDERASLERRGGKFLELVAVR